MNLRQLEAFRATIRGGSITAAAGLLHISQPSVSRLIADLERSLKFKLFIRGGQGLIATAEARRFHQTVESMFIGLDKLQDSADAIRNTRNETVTLAVIPIFANAVMPQALEVVRQQRPELYFDISVRNGDGIIDALLLQQIDLGVICPIQHYPGIELLYQTEVDYQCLLAVDHPLVKIEGRLDLRQLTGEEFVTLDPDYLAQIIDDAELLRTLRLQTRVIARSDLAIAAIAQTSKLIAIVDPFTACRAAQTGDVVVRDLQQKIKYPIAIVARSNDALPLAGKAIASALQDEFENWQHHQPSSGG
ncbi:MAG: DNA-binding transcriptional LysR family regulator [Planctomycetota bacterium]|jgi:DNA-binding transcriptional LysR family regulator